MEDLQHTWAEATEQWNDEASRAFATQHLEPLIPVVKTALDAISRMDMLLTQAQRDCER